MDLSYVRLLRISRERSLLFAVPLEYADARGLYKKDNPYCISLHVVDNYFDKTVDVLVLIEKIKVISTKKGDKMAFFTGSDETGSKEFILFPKTYNMYSKIEKGNLIKIRGHVEKRLDAFQIIVEKLKLLEGENNE